MFDIDPFYQSDKMCQYTILFAIEAPTEFSIASGKILRMECWLPCPCPRELVRGGYKS